MIEAGIGTTVFGVGTRRNPYVVNYSDFELLGSTTEEAEVTVTGDGSPGNPWTVKIDKTGNSPVTVTQFVFDGTWFKPPGCSVVYVHLIGGGGAGGTAYPENLLTERRENLGSGGGGGGAVSSAWFLADSLPDAVEVRKGQAGIPIDSNRTGHDRGGDGGPSAFGDFLFASGGQGGGGAPDGAVWERAGRGGAIGTAPSGGPGGYGSGRISTSSTMPAESRRRMNTPGGGGAGVQEWILGTGHLRTLGAVQEISDLGGPFGVGPGGDGAADDERPIDPIRIGGGGGGGGYVEGGGNKTGPGGYGQQGSVLVVAW